MPLYEYKCEAGHHFEKIVKFSDPPLEACPTCGARVEKLFSSPAIQFKGSGWYITDYAKKSASDSASGKSAGKSSTDTAKSDSTKSDSTPAPSPASSTKD